MTFTCLASSSRGNCYLVGDGETEILLECGLPWRRLRKQLGFDLSSIRGCLVSHEHQDHARSVKELLRSGVEVFASEGTAEALDCPLITCVEAGGQFRAGSLEILPFQVWHDGREPLGFLIYSRKDGERLAFATDTVNLGYQFPGVNLLCLECNHDAALLERCERMPEKVRRRIANNHMEVHTLCRYLRGLDLGACRALYLLHMSTAAASGEDAVRLVRRAVPEQVEVILCQE